MSNRPNFAPLLRALGPTYSEAEIERALEAGADVSSLAVIHAALLRVLEEVPGEQGERYRRAFKTGAIDGLRKILAAERPTNGGETP